jgi:hypothetical protein
VKNAARGAVVGINKAFGLYEIDRQMCLFRAITAEEEASTAVIESLKKRKYKGAEKLNSRKHPHKISIWPFANLILKTFSLVQEEIEVSYEFKTNNINNCIEPRIGIQVLNSQTPLIYYPDPPLNMIFKNGSTGKYFDFSKEVVELAAERQSKNFLDFAKREANIRNKILYSCSGGLPKIQGGLLATLEARRYRVMFLLRLCLLIDFYKEKQTLVQGCLDVLLRNV